MNPEIPACRSGWRWGGPTLHRGRLLLFTFGEEGGKGSGELLLPGGLRSEQQGAPDPLLADLWGHYCLRASPRSQVFFMGR